jgi:SpoVK/Ycf46/Vps4 family AAA+-type ATPase
MLTDLLNRTHHSLTTHDIRAVADILHGYLAGDISSLLSEAQRTCRADYKVAECSSESEERLPGTAKVTVDHLRAAVLRVRPSGAAHLGQEETKRALQEAVEWPITHKAAFRRLGIAPPKGA